MNMEQLALFSFKGVVLNHHTECAKGKYVLSIEALQRHMSERRLPCCGWDVVNLLNEFIEHTGVAEVSPSNLVIVELIDSEAGSEGKFETANDEMLVVRWLEEIIGVERGDPAEKLQK